MSILETPNQVSEKQRKKILKRFANQDHPAAPIYREYYKREYGTDPCH